MNEPGVWDILVWIDEDGDVVCRAQSSFGLTHLQTMYPNCQTEDILQILCTPDQFRNALPEGMLVGLVMEPNKKVVPMDKIRLH